MVSFRNWYYFDWGRGGNDYKTFNKMNLFDILRLIGISLGFIVIIIIFIITNETSCFSPNQIFMAYLLLIYTIVVEIFSLIFREDRRW